MSIQSGTWSFLAKAIAFVLAIVVVVVAILAVVVDCSQGLSRNLKWNIPARVLGKARGEVAVLTENGN